MVLTANKVEEAFHKGARKAFNQHLKWSGDWLHLAPEYVLTTYVAESIGNLEGTHWVSLEWPMREVLDGLKKTTGPVDKSMRKDGRPDIVLWDRGLKPWGIIEIKNQGVNGLSKSGIEGDIVRISTAIEKRKLRFGAIGLYIGRHKKGKKPAIDLVLGTLETLEKNFAGWEPSRKIGGDDKQKDAWASFFAWRRP